MGLVHAYQHAEQTARSERRVLCPVATAFQHVLQELIFLPLGKAEHPTREQVNQAKLLLVDRWQETRAVRPDHASCLLGVFEQSYRQLQEQLVSLLPAQSLIAEIERLERRGKGRSNVGTGAAEHAGRIVPGVFIGEGE